MVICGPNASMMKEPPNRILSVLYSSRYHGFGAEPETVSVPKALLREKGIKKNLVGTG